MGHCVNPCEAESTETSLWTSVNRQTLFIKAADVQSERRVHRFVPTCDGLSWLDFGIFFMLRHFSSSGTVEVYC